MTTLNARIERAALEARQLDPVKVLRTVVSVPFFVLFFVLGLVWGALTLVWAAGWVGFRDGRDTARRAAGD